MSALTRRRTSFRPDDTADDTASDLDGNDPEAEADTEPDADDPTPDTTVDAEPDSEPGPRGFEPNPDLDETAAGMLNAALINRNPDCRQFEMVVVEGEYIQDPDNPTVAGGLDYETVRVTDDSAEETHYLMPHNMIPNHDFG